MRGARLKRFAGPNNHLIIVESHVAKTFSESVKNCDLGRGGPSCLRDWDFYLIVVKPKRWFICLRIIAGAYCPRSACYR